MIKVYICPKCGWVREVSRRKSVECYQCGAGQMALTDVLYEAFVEWTPQEREEFSRSWVAENGKAHPQANRESADGA